MDFRTARLAAESLSLAYLGDPTELHLDPEVTHYLGGIGSPARTEAYLGANLARWVQHGCGLWVFRTAGGPFAGRPGIRHTEVEGEPEVEIAYALRRDLWR
jgi:[ribosomal protein S5]-alanine N-acetyltransferase